jgi:hypothetical protein
VVRIRLHAELVERSVPVLLRGAILSRIDGMEGPISAVVFEVVVGLMSGLVFPGWSVEAFTFLEKWPGLLVSTLKVSILKVSFLEALLEARTPAGNLLKINPLRSFRRSPH